MTAVEVAKRFSVMSLSLCSSRTFLLKGKFITCKQNFYSAEVRSYRKLIKSGRLRVFVFLIALPVYSLPASDPNIHGAVALEFRETAYPTDRAPRYDKPATAGPGGRNTPGWHLSDKLIVPPNITLVPLRPNAPNSNPVENVWQFI